MRRRATILLDEEDLFYLLALNPGERVVAQWASPPVNGIVIGIEGDETSDIPTVAPGFEPERISRPYALHELRRSLAVIMAESWRESHSPEDYYRAVTKAVEENIWPHLSGRLA